MAPRGRKRKVGMMREDAARDAMRNYGFDERVIKEAIKELLEVYGNDSWKLIEEDRYDGLLNICLEKQGQQEETAEQQGEEPQEQEQETHQAEEETVVEQQQEEETHEEEEETVVEQQQQQETHEAEEETVVDQQQEEEETKEQERDHVGSTSTSMVGCVTDAMTEAFPTDAASNTSEAVMDSAPTPFTIEGSSQRFALEPVEGAMNSRNGWLSSEEETDREEDSDGEDDDEDDDMIQLTPEPLSEGLKELLRKIRRQKKENKASRWDN